MNKNLFNSTKVQRLKRNRFDLSHEFKFSGNMGDLYPVCLIDTVPGDKFDISAECFIRFAPMLAPVMHRIDVYVHHFFVPNRILWDGWDEFITGRAERAAPYVFTNSLNTAPLFQYLGVPRPAVPLQNFEVNALPFAAYQMIFNEYYRSEQLQDEVAFKCIDGDNSANGDLGVLRARGWMHDYFTSALPNPQMGNAVGIPLDLLVVGQNSNPGGTTIDGLPDDLKVNPGHTDAAFPDGTLFATNTGAPGMSGSINDLRRANALQRFLERLNVAGDRLNEFIFGMFGVRTSDSRLQRPEYICGYKNPVSISDVPNTTGTDDAPQGNLAGYGLAAGSGNHGSYFCEEHGFIMGIMSVIPKPAYQQGLARKFTRFDRFDYFTPMMANIGEQPILNKELYMDLTMSEANEVFGYIPRYSEYKYETDRVAGDFTTTLNYWHLGRIFDDIPTLNAEFIECIPSTRIFSVIDPSTDHLYCQVKNHIYATRPMPKFGTPSL